MSDQANKPPRRKAYMLQIWEERLGPADADVDSDGRERRKIRGEGRAAAKPELDAPGGWGLKDRSGMERFVKELARDNFPWSLLKLQK